MSMILPLLLACSFSINNSKNKYGARVETKRSVGKSFERISIKGSIDVHYMQSNDNRIVVVAPHELINLVKTEVVHNQLDIYCVEKNLNNADIDVYVYAPTLAQVQINGSGDFKAGSIENNTPFVAQIAGSGDIGIGKLSCSKATIGVKGSGDINIKQLTCQGASLDIAGSGDAEIGFYNADDININIAGSGDVTSTLTRCGTVNCSVRGSGDITLNGDARQINKSVHGSGKISTKHVTMRNR